MNPVQRPLENVFKHPPIIMDLAVTNSNIEQEHKRRCNTISEPNKYQHISAGERVSSGMNATI